MGTILRPPLMKIDQYGYPFKGVGILEMICNGSIVLILRPRHYTREEIQESLMIHHYTDEECSECAFFQAVGVS